MKRFLLLLFSYGLFLSLHADDRNLSKLQYWFDGNQAEMTEQVLSGIQQDINQTIDVSSLREGMHTLYYRIGDTAGQWSPLQVWSFFVVSAHYKESKEIKAVEYWMDDKLSERNTTEINGQSVWIQTLDVSTLSEGFHTLNYRIKDSSEQWSPLLASSFFVAPLRDKGAKAIKAVEYWLDDNTAERKTTEVSGNTWQQALDVSDLSEGMHTLYYRFVDNYNDYSSVSQSVFFKTQKRASQIKTLRYWWGTYTDKAEDVEVNDANYTYEALLTVPDYARQDLLTDLGVARFNCVAIDDQGRQSAPFYQDVIYATGPRLKTNRYSQASGSSITLSWTYADANGIKDYIVYYAKDNGPYVMYIPSTNGTSIDFIGSKGIYRFLVVARNNAGQRTSMDNEWSVLVSFE